MRGVPEQREVQSIIERVKSRLGDGGTAPSERSAPRRPPRELGEGIYSNVEGAVGGAWEAFGRFAQAGLERRKEIVANLRSALRESAADLARHAREETGLGRVEDKEVDALRVIDKTPGPEDLEPAVTTGDRGMTVTEFAPFGVVAAITPTTNPTATLINNTIAAISAGNGLVFNVHPNAREVSVETVRRINRAVVEAGGPPNLVTTIEHPSIASAQELMRHPSVRLLLVTGGPAVVDEALKTRKRAVTRRCW